ncbi:MAG: aspartyl protease family protein [Saprospiraceae bacterium]|nr:aspartyl protease family protein [Saprospiraceae bacterium]
MLVNANAQTVLYETQQDDGIVTIPFTLVNNLPVVTVTINGLLPLQFIFDTGAEHNLLIIKELGDALGLIYEKKVTIYGADLSSEMTAALARNISLTAGDMTANAQGLLVLDRDYFRFEELTGTQIHGILGASFFHNFITKIDYPLGRIMLIPREQFKPPNKHFDILPLKIIRNKPYIQTAVTLANDTVVQSLLLLLDTGASLSLLLQTNSHPHLQPPKQAIAGNLGIGIGGVLQGFLGRVKFLQFGKFQIPQVLTNYQSLSNSPLDLEKSVTRNGIIGSLVLSRFVLYFDYFEQKLYLRARKGFDAPFEYDRSGLLVIAGGEKLQDFIIHDVLPNSPATMAGIRRGDKIIKLNGRPSRRLTLEKIVRKLQRKAGKKVTLQLLRNNEILIKEIVLRDLI